MHSQVGSKPGRHGREAKASLQPFMHSMDWSRKCKEAAFPHGLRRMTEEFLKCLDRRIAGIAGAGVVAGGSLRTPLWVLMANHSMVLLIRVRLICESVAGAGDWQTKRDCGAACDGRDAGPHRFAIMDETLSLSDWVELWDLGRWPFWGRQGARWLVCICHPDSGIIKIFPPLPDLTDSCFLHWR